MPEPVPPDPLSLLVPAVRAVPPLTLIISTRVSTKLPTAPVYPLIVLSRVGGRSGDWSEPARVQFDCWAETEGQASLLARTLVAEHRNLRGTYPGGRIVLTSVVSGPLPQPDLVSGRPREIVDLLVQVAAL